MLALDIGNGSIKYARFADGRRLDGGRLPLDDDLDLSAAQGCAAVSVNPPVLDRVRRALAGLRVVGQDIPLPIDIAYDNPSDLGADRVMAVHGALHRRDAADGVLVLDVGTCLTATVGVRGRGVLGGAILPGGDLMARALATGTARLPHVDPGPSPVPALGRSTDDAIRAGIDAAVCGAARELIRRLRREVSEQLDVVAAGTGAGALAAALPEIDAVHPFATLWGVYLAAREHP